jgi:hypothetical protein
MAALTFDTLRVARRLRDAGMSESQAEALTDALRESIASSELVTKADLTTLASELKATVADTKAEIIKWMFGAMAAQVAVILAVMKLLPSH